MSVAVRILGAAMSFAVACGGATDRPSPPAAERLVGVIVEVGADPETGDVTSFVLDVDGERVAIAIDRRVDYGFDLDHLYEHATSGDPVDVRVVARDGERLAREIADA